MGSVGVILLGILITAGAIACLILKLITVGAVDKESAVCNTDLESDPH
jgi:hypothetical protein